MTDPRLARPSWRGRTNVDALTIACIERAESIGGHEFVVTQGSYQSGGGDINSAGTHDLGGVVDLRWCGHVNCVRALRLAGMAAWHRKPTQGPWPDHIHAVVIDHPRLALSASNQVASYRAGRNGLKSQRADDGPRVNPIPAPTFPWPTKEEVVRPEDIKAIKDALLSHQITVKTPAGKSRRISVEQALVETFNKAARADRQTQEG